MFKSFVIRGSNGCVVTCRKKILNDGFLEIVKETKRKEIVKETKVMMVLYSKEGRFETIVNRSRSSPQSPPWYRKKHPSLNWAMEVNISSFIEGFVRAEIEIFQL